MQVCRTGSELLKGRLCVGETIRSYRMKTCPDVPLLIFEQGNHTVLRQAFRVVGMSSVSDESLVVSIKLQEPVPHCGEPHRSIVVFEDGVNSGQCVAGRFPVVKRVPNHSVRLTVENRQAAARSIDNPEDTEAVFME